MKRKLLFSAVVLALVTITGCYPGSDRTLENTEVIFTTFDDGFDFSKNKTYFLVDEVTDIDTLKTVDQNTQNTIKQRIRDNMNSKGWQEITTTISPGDTLPTLDVEVVIHASLLTGTIEGVSYWPGYGCWWGGWYGWGGYPGYGWGGVAIPYSYDIGTIFIDMIDYSTYNPEDERSLTLVWTAAMNGVLSSTSVGVTSRIQRVIDQSYAQSPYL